ncbi:MAG: DNA polymerase III subunit epsilon [Gammaproteobacteria bacterium]|jgi:DNA polymerase III subunit epsilon
MANRQIVLDTETTGLEPEQGHRIIEIGCVELINRRPTGNDYHQYIKPDRLIDEGAIEVHGITNEALADKPPFEEIADDLLAYLRGAELVIHNAPFDVGFLNHELARIDTSLGRVGDFCSVVDTLVLARSMHPGQRNSLDALCKRYDIDNSHRQLHGALLDARILADVYLRMTGGQTALSLDGETREADSPSRGGSTRIRRLPADRKRLPVISASDAESAAHEARLTEIAKASGGRVLWTALTGQDAS